MGTSKTLADHNESSVIVFQPTSPLLSLNKSSKNSGVQKKIIPHTSELARLPASDQYTAWEIVCVCVCVCVCVEVHRIPKEEGSYMAPELLQGLCSTF